MIIRVYQSLGGLGGLEGLGGLGGLDNPYTDFKH